MAPEVELGAGRRGEEIKEMLDTRNEDFGESLSLPDVLAPKGDGVEPGKGDPAMGQQGAAFLSRHGSDSSVAADAADFFGDPLKFLREILESVGGDVTVVASLDARRASDAEPVPMLDVRLPDGSAEQAPVGGAKFVDIETTKKRITDVENEIPWSESYQQAVDRKTAQLQGQGKTKDAARTEAIAWYKDASLRRRQAAEARMKETAPNILDALNQAFPNGDAGALEAAAKHKAEQDAKAVWDQGLKDAKSDLPVVVDTNIPGMGYDYLRVVDHHGAFLTKANGGKQNENATMQMMNHFESALRAAGAKDINHPTEAEVARAIELLNLKEITTDNLGDGAWSVWMAQHQAEVMKNPELRKLIRNATYFEDFTAFSQGGYERGEPAVELQAALFFEYGKILDKYGIKGSDRIPADKAEAIMKDTMEAMDGVINDPAARAKVAERFWQDVDFAREEVKKSEVDVGDAGKVNGQTVIRFYDMRNVRIPKRDANGEWMTDANGHAVLDAPSVFAGWLSVPDIYRGSNDPLPIQVTIAPVFRQAKDTAGEPVFKTNVDGTPMIGPDGKKVPVMEVDPDRTLPIVAIPFGNQVGGKQGMLAVKDPMAKAEKGKADAAGGASNPWFGKDAVILPIGGSRLSPTEIATIVTDPKNGLFDTKGASGTGEGTGDRLTTPDGRMITGLQPLRTGEVKGFGAQKAYGKAQKLIGEYGVSPKHLPRAKGERLADMARAGDPRAVEALNLLYGMKGDANMLKDLSDNGSGEQWMNVQTERLNEKADRFEVLMKDLGPSVDKAPEIPEARRGEVKQGIGDVYEDVMAQDAAQDAKNLSGGVGWVSDYRIAINLGNAYEQAVGQDVKTAVDSSREILHQIEVLENGLKGPMDTAERKLAENALNELYGILERNLKTVDRWKSYGKERRDFENQVSVFEFPFLMATTPLGGGAMSVLGFNGYLPEGVKEVLTQSPDFAQDFNTGIGRSGDYVVTILVDTAESRDRINGDIWAAQNLNNAKWARDGQGRYLRIVDGKGREMQVRVQVATPDAVVSRPVPQSAPKAQHGNDRADDAVPYDLAAKRVSNGWDATGGDVTQH